MEHQNNDFPQEPPQSPSETNASDSRSIKLGEIARALAYDNLSEQILDEILSVINDEPAPQMDAMRQALHNAICANPDIDLTSQPYLEAYINFREHVIFEYYKDESHPLHVGMCEVIDDIERDEQEEGGTHG